MARHSITVVHRTIGSSSNTERQDKPTSARKNISSSGVSNRNIQSTTNNKTYLQSRINKLIGAGLAVAAIKTSQLSINIYSSVGEAATGNSLYYDNLKSKANLILNPISSVKEITTQAVLGNLRLQRENRALEYQRQLTGNLAFSRKNSTGTF